MAVFEYGCSSCGIQQEKLFRKEPPDAIRCPECGAQANRLLSDFGFVFGDGKVPGNTGVHSLDSDHDKRIGRDAQDRWEYIKDRNSRKDKVRREHGGTTPLRLNKEGEYEPMPQKDVQRFRKLHKQNSEALAQADSDDSD